MDVSFTFYTKSPPLLLISDTWLELWVQLECMDDVFLQCLYRIVDHYPITVYTQRCLFSSAYISAVHAAYIKYFLPFRPVTLHWHLLGLQATFLNVVQWAVCWKNASAGGYNTRPGSLKHKTSGWHLQQAQYRWRHGPEMTAVCDQHRPVFAVQESTDIITVYVNHCSPVRISMRFTASLPAHPLLRMNDYGTDRRGKMLLMRCMNNPGWIERGLFSLAYFSQVRDEKKGCVAQNDTRYIRWHTGQWAASSRVISLASHSKCVWGQICLLG